MKTTTLVIGLVQLFGALCCALSVFGFADSIPLIVLFTVFMVVNIIGGVGNVMESLFGDDGLICEAFGKVDTDDDE